MHDFDIDASRMQARLAHFIMQEAPITLVTLILAYDAPVTPVAPVITYNMAAGILAEVATDATPIVVTVTATTVHVS